MIAALQASVDGALAARRRLRGRAAGETARALATAAERWAADAPLAAALPEAAHLSPAMVAAVLPLVAGAVDADALVELHAREAGPHAPELVAHVLASNVPALAVPAIVHACLAGAAVLVKSGRADTLSAPAFQRALAAVDPELAATVVATYWPGGTTDVEDALLGRADVVVATGGDAATAALARRLGPRTVAFGERTSLAVLPGDAPDVVLDALARDVALYDQRGCLSPHAVVVVGGDPATLGERLVLALARVARDLPAAAIPVADRAAHRLALEEARFAGARILEGPGGTAIVDPGGRGGAAIGRRTVRLRGIGAPPDLLEAFAPHAVECVGVAGGVPLDAEALRRRGVARLCPVGRMQQPRIDWPRGQRPALGTLFRTAGEARIQVEP